MSKDAVIQIRVETDTKGRLELAAQERGLTLTRFLVDAGLREAHRQLPQRSRHRGVPAVFRTACDEAGRGGAGGYERVGYMLSLQVVKLLEPIGNRQRRARLVELRELLDQEELDECLAWFVREFPKSMALIPKRRREQFARGALRAHEERDAFRMEAK